MVDHPEASGLICPAGNPVKLSLQTEADQSRLHFHCCCAVDPNNS